MAAVPAPAAHARGSLRDRFTRDGYVVVESFLSSAELEALQLECACVLAQSGVADALARGCVFETDLSEDREQRSAACAILSGERVQRLLSELSVERRAPSAERLEQPSLLNEQFIVKPPQCVSSAFAWHRDQDGLVPDTQSYVSLWFALDDAHEENGGLYLLPGSHAADTRIPDDPSAHACIAEAGTLVVLHSRLLHSSSANLSDFPRRAWMPQMACTLG